MKLLKTLILSFVLSSVACVYADDIPPQPTLAAKAFLLRDFASGQVLASQFPDERMEPASLTKLMTGYLAFKAVKNHHLELNQNIPVSVKAWKGGGIGCGGGNSSCMFIEPNKPVTVDELLHGMIVVSGNDASVALAEAIGGSEEGFADLMNKEAARLGMKGTHFVNAAGLSDPNHYTTANDLSILAMALIRDFPAEYKRLYSLKEYSYNKITQPNRNRLLWIDPYVDGMKTGHTSAAGYCLVASAKHGDMRLISVMLGTPSESTRITESQRLLNYGFQFYEQRTLYGVNQNVSTLKVWKGVEKEVSAVVAGGLTVTLPKGQADRLKATVTAKQPLIAPLAAGQEIGSIQITLDGKPMLERKLVAAKEIPVTGLFGRLADSVRLMFNK